MLVQLARMLIERGADPTLATSNGTTLLHEATARNLRDFVDFLAKHKANLDQRDHQGNAPLHIAIADRNLELLDRLLDHGADPDLTDERGWTTLDRLAEKKDRESPIVQRLIVAGGQYNKQLPLNPDMLRPRKGNHPTGSRDGIAQTGTKRLIEAQRDSAVTPVKKIITRRPPNN